MPSTAVVAFGSALLGSLFGAALVYGMGRKIVRKELKSVRQRLPKRLILVRHGQSEANVNTDRYREVGDVHVQLTDQGWAEAQAAGRALRDELKGETVRFFVSPYVRTRETLRGILESFGGEEQAEWTEEPRLREHEKGLANERTEEEFMRVWGEALNYSPFWYRWPRGESMADVYDRCDAFRQTLHRYFQDRPETQNYVVVSHSITVLLFLKRVLGFSSDEVESFMGLPNACVCILESAPAKDEHGRARNVGQEFFFKRLFVAAPDGSFTHDWRPAYGDDNITMVPKEVLGFSDSSGQEPLYYKPRRRVIRSGPGPITSDPVPGNGLAHK